MSGEAKTGMDDSEAAYFAEAMGGMFGGGREPSFTQKTAPLFGLAVAMDNFQARKTLAERRAFVDRFMVVIQEQSDEATAKHREMAGGGLGKLFGGLMGTPEDLEEKVRTQMAELRDYLYRIVDDVVKEEVPDA